MKLKYVSVYKIGSIILNNIKRKLIYYIYKQKKDDYISSYNNKYFI